MPGPCHLYPLEWFHLPRRKQKPAPLAYLGNGLSSYQERLFLSAMPVPPCPVRFRIPVPQKLQPR
jgi:hypothetical protein